MLKNIIIDTDPGVDDAFALAYAFNQVDFNILGITTVVGNNSLDNINKNATGLVNFFEKDIKVYPGQARPLVERPKRKSNGLSSNNDGAICHGQDGLGGVAKDLKFGRVEEKSGVDFILEMAKKYDDLSIVALGPLTNIARAIEIDPGLMKNIKEIVSMGGGINRGNVTEYAEFNYWVDPRAAQIVYDFSIPITMVGLNATDGGFFSRKEFQAMRDTKTKVGKLLYDMQQIYSHHYNMWYGIDGCRIHDLVAMVIAGDRSLAQGRYGKVDILQDELRRGESLVDFSANKTNAFIVEELDIEKYKKLVNKIIFT